MKNVYTNMCMVMDGEKILVLNRVKKDWPGLTFPGGHVEAGELFSESVIREMKEETGLTIEDPKYMGKIVWPLPDKKINDVALLYRTSKFKGEVLASKEGEVFFIKKSELSNYEHSLDFDKVLAIMFKD